MTRVIPSACNVAQKTRSCRFVTQSFTIQPEYLYHLAWAGRNCGMVFASTLNQFHLHRMGTSSTCMQTDGSAGPLFVVGGEGSIIGIPIGAALLQVLQNLATCWAF